MKINKLIKRIIKDVACRFTTQNHLLRYRTNALLIDDYKQKNINVIYDIGAHQGDWATEIHSLMPNAHFILFEANPQHEKKLAQLGHRFFNTVLTKPGIQEVEFFVPSGAQSTSTGASYLKEITPHYEHVKVTVLKATTLDELLSTYSLPQPDLIKIDTQGSELDIIEGGRKIFSGAKWILMELPLIEYNEGAPDFSLYIATLDELGFAPVEVAEIHHYGRIAFQIDLLFLNKKFIDSTNLQALRLIS
jgi:FkbM family methyltransferase